MSTMVTVREPALVPATPVPALEHAQPLRICAECAHAQIFAVQPRAVCALSGGRREGDVLFAGQPACPDFAQGGGSDLALAWCTPGVKITSRRFGGRRS